MGLLKHLLFWPVTGPLYLTEFSMEKVRGVVRKELTDDTRIKEALMELHLRLETGEIDQKQYVEEEAELMAQLREVRRWRQKFGMGTRGGPVQVAQDEAEERSAETALPSDADVEVSLDDEGEWFPDSSGSEPGSSSS